MDRQTSTPSGRAVRILEAVIAEAAHAAKTLEDAARKFRGLERRARHLLEEDHGIPPPTRGI